MREKINSLQGLRVIAMLIIFLYHTELFPFGHFAVTFFFILSGFVAYYSDTSKDTLSLKESIIYSLKKIEKFYPIYFFTVILAAVLKFDILKTYSLKKIFQVFFVILL